MKITVLYILYSLWQSLLWVVRAQRPCPCQEWYAKLPKASHFIGLFIFKELCEHPFTTPCLGGKNYSHFIDEEVEVEVACWRPPRQSRVWWSLGRSADSTSQLNRPQLFLSCNFPVRSPEGNNINLKAANTLEEERNTKSFCFVAGCLYDQILGNLDITI